MKTFIIGDIHGAAKALSRLLIRLRPDEDSDRLILLGDLFDRGPDSYEVFRAVQRLSEDFGERFCLLLGNHEDYLLRDKTTFLQKMMWDRVGRQATVRSFRAHGMEMEQAAPWIRENARLFERDETLGLQCVHAGIRVDPLEANDRDTLLHDHHAVLSNAYQGPLTVTGHIALVAPTWFAGDGQTVEQVPYGETRPLPDRGVFCIDTGCGKGGPLTGMAVWREDGRTMYRLEKAMEE